MNVRIGWFKQIEEPAAFVARPQASYGTRGGALAVGRSGTRRMPAMTTASASRSTFEEPMVTVPPPLSSESSGRLHETGFIYTFPRSPSNRSRRGESFLIAGPMCAPREDGNVPRNHRVRPELQRGPTEGCGGWDRGRNRPRPRRTGPRCRDGPEPQPFRDHVHRGQDGSR